MKVLFLEKSSPEIIDILKKETPPNINLVTLETDHDEEKKLKAADADVFLVGPAKVTRELIYNAPKLKLIQKAGIGWDKIDCEAARERGIPVAITAGANKDAVAEHTVLLILSLYRRLPYAVQTTKAGEWRWWELRGTTYELWGKTLGIIGLGNIGSEVAKRIKPFGVRTLYYDIRRRSRDEERELNVEFTPLAKLLKSSDIVSLHVTLTEQAKKMIGSREFSLMKKNAILINTSRGEVVDENALFDALKQGYIAGAALDVLSKEPPDPRNPLLNLDNVIITPHSAPTRDTLPRVFQQAMRNIMRVASGEEPLDVIN